MHLVKLTEKKRKLFFNSTGEKATSLKKFPSFSFGTNPLIPYCITMERLEKMFPGEGNAYEIVEGGSMQNTTFFTIFPHLVKEDFNYQKALNEMKKQFDFSATMLDSYGVYTN